VPVDVLFSAKVYIGVSGSPFLFVEYNKGKIGKATRVTGRGGPKDSETLRFPHFLHNRPTDGAEVLSLTRRPPFTPKKIPGTHFC
jgi:hypothetical protein